MLRGLFRVFSRAEGYLVVMSCSYDGYPVWVRGKTGIACNESVRAPECEAGRLPRRSFAVEEYFNGTGSTLVRGFVGKDRFGSGAFGRE